MSGHIDHFGLRHVRGGPPADGQPDSGPGVRVMAINDNFHNWMLPTVLIPGDDPRTPAENAGSEPRPPIRGSSRVPLPGVVIMGA